MKGVNKVILIGHLGKDPETKHMDNNQVTNFALATSESYTDKKGQKVDSTEWHSIVIWGKLSEIAEKYLSKGSLIYLEGKIKTRSWDDKDGNKRYITEVIASSFTMLDNKSSQTREPQESQVETNSDDEDGELPF